jgi:D-3-phosphoglycerate dehydrogenase
LTDSGFDIVPNPYKRKITKSELKQMIDEDVVGIIAGLETLNCETLENTNVEVVSRVGSGISNLDIEYLNNKNIKFFSTPDGPVNSVAELTVSSIISLLRHTHILNNKLHKNNWERIIGSELSGKKVFIFGYGRIGKRVAEILNFLNADVFVVDPYIESVPSELKLSSKNEALNKADIITIHSSGEDEIISENDFLNLKKNIYICNPSRGHCISEKGLIGALVSNKVIGTWLDTFNEEPYSGELGNFEQVILSPHIGSYTKECRLNMELQAVNNLLSCF